ncbi:type 1 glutamine amidotransferase [Streptomyces sp. NBC_01408]|uniref:type 1 glutamine amidotransferase n=1 Tax=Streptomyces sp. NBC_01408 TaxID=2903855 RepID=UPI00224D634D|nr:type 1 glutamine amidotransferase [Streptomyces sp. NBC_01408]MCX4695628.1 type 1 glutamine amidotransferase [Streptomyces sp. NBC_01408]
MQALIIKHEHLSTPGYVGERLTERGYDLTELVVVPEERFTDPGVTGSFPAASAYDLIVALGAPWSVDHVELIGPWITPEVELLCSAHAAGIPVLGICFGGQALATALGGRVERSPRFELGWTRVDTDDDRLVPAGPWFQFHGDRWHLPPGAREIARNSVCSQAFVHGRSMGLQFHPELTPAVLEQWLVHGGEAMAKDAGLVPAELMARTWAEARHARARAHALVDAFLALAAR